jgi:hypothetical protein
MKSLTMLEALVMKHILLICDLYVQRVGKDLVLVSAIQFLLCVDCHQTERYPALSKLPVVQTFNP